MNCKEYDIESNDNVNLHVRKYFCFDSEKRPTLLIIHGMSEHGLRYVHVARHFVDRGWNVIVPDQRGHGRSGGVPTHVNRFQQYCEDIETIRQYFELIPEQTAILAHSMGGLVAIRYCQTYPDHVKALVLSSPLLGVKVKIPKSTLIAGKVLSYIYPLKRFKSRVDQSFTTRNVAKLKERANDPLIHQSVTAGWFFSMQAALIKAWSEVESITLPVMIVQAGDDYIVDPVVPEGWLALASSEHKEYVFLEDHYHEVLNEPDWETTIVQIEDWLNVRMGYDSSHFVVPNQPAKQKPVSNVEPLIN